MNIAFSIIYLKNLLAYCWFGVFFNTEDGGNMLQSIPVTQTSGSLPPAASGVYTSVSTLVLPRLAVDKIFFSGIQVA
jgi:hypothetical protein